MKNATPAGPLWMRLTMLTLFGAGVVFLTWFYAKAYDTVVSFVNPLL